MTAEKALTHKLLRGTCETNSLRWSAARNYWRHSSGCIIVGGRQSKQKLTGWTRMLRLCLQNFIWINCKCKRFQNVWFIHKII